MFSVHSWESKVNCFMRISRRVRVNFLKKFPVLLCLIWTVIWKWNTAFNYVILERALFNRWESLERPREWWAWGSNRCKRLDIFRCCSRRHACLFPLNSFEEKAPTVRRSSFLMMCLTGLAKFLGKVLFLTFLVSIIFSFDSLFVCICARHTENIFLWKWILQLILRPISSRWFMNLTSFINILHHKMIFYFNYSKLQMC